MSSFTDETRRTVTGIATVGCVWAFVCVWAVHSRLT